MFEKLTSLLFQFWIWLTNRKLEPEHIGMAGAIIVSTWHVLNHMAAVEAAAVVAVVMGTLLGFTNALAAMRYFESEDVRWPAGITVLFSACVSIGMQYGFYDNNSNLTPYMIGNVNANALMFGLWAPVIEILLGWLYGARLKVRHRTDGAIDRIRQECSRQIESIQGKLNGQLSANQDLRDELYQFKMEVQNRDALIAAKDATIAQLHEKNTDLRVQKAGLDAKLDAHLAVQKPVQNEGSKPVKLNATERRRRVDELHNDMGMSIAEIARQLRIAKNTVRADLRELQPTIHPNGHNGATS